jgi:hypothetical protein
MSMSQMQPNFDQLLIESIQQGLKKVLGEENAKCVTFYIDPHIAVANPDNYARSILKLLGTGTKVLLDEILDNLYQKTGAKRNDDGSSFGDIVNNARHAYLQRGTKTS